MKNKFMAVAAAGLLSIGVSDNAVADDTEDPIVKCYGLAKANKNDCAHARGVHGCAAQAAINYDPCEWKAVAKSECLNGVKEDGKNIVGTLTPENCKGSSDPEGEVDTTAEKESSADAGEANAEVSSPVAQENGNSTVSSSANESVDNSKIPVTDAPASLITDTGAGAPSDESSADSDN